MLARLAAAKTNEGPTMHKPKIITSATVRLIYFIYGVIL
jgi:hypothetical protein